MGCKLVIEYVPVPAIVSEETKDPTPNGKPPPSHHNPPRPPPKLPPTETFSVNKDGSYQVSTLIAIRPSLPDSLKPYSYGHNERPFEYDTYNKYNSLYKDGGYKNDHRYGVFDMGGNRPPPFDYDDDRLYEYSSHHQSSSNSHFESSFVYRDRPHAIHHDMMPFDDPYYDNNHKPYRPEFDKLRPSDSPNHYLPSINRIPERPKPSNYGERPSNVAYDRPERPSYDSRPDYYDRPERPSLNDRPGRPNYDDRLERPNYNDRPVRPNFNDRPERPNLIDRPERPNYNDRPARPSFNDRPEHPNYNDRPEQTNFYDRPERPSYNHRPDYPSLNERPERPNYNDRPELIGYNQPSHNKRPTGYGDRPINNERPYHSDHQERPSQYNDRDKPRPGFTNEYMHLSNQQPLNKPLGPHKDENSGHSNEYGSNISHGQPEIVPDRPVVTNKDTPNEKPNNEGMYTNSEPSSRPNNIPLRPRPSGYGKPEEHRPSSEQYDRPVRPPPKDNRPENTYRPDRPEYEPLHIPSRPKPDEYSKPLNELYNNEAPMNRPINYHNNRPSFSSSDGYSSGKDPVRPAEIPLRPSPEYNYNRPYEFMPYKPVHKPYDDIGFYGFYEDVTPYGRPFTRPDKNFDKHNNDKPTRPSYYGGDSYDRPYYKPKPPLHMDDRVSYGYNDRFEYSYDRPYGKPVSVDSLRPNVNLTNEGSYNVNKPETMRVPTAPEYGDQNKDKANGTSLGNHQEGKFF